MVILLLLFCLCNAFLQAVKGQKRIYCANRLKLQSEIFSSTANSGQELSL